MIWGIMGAFLATPITAVVRIVLGRIPITRPLADMLAGNLDGAFGRAVERISIRSRRPRGQLRFCGVLPQKLGQSPDFNQDGVRISIRSCVLSFACTNGMNFVLAHDP